MHKSDRSDRCSSACIFAITSPCSPWRHSFAAFPSSRQHLFAQTSPGELRRIDHRWAKMFSWRRLDSNLQHLDSYHVRLSDWASRTLGLTSRKVIHKTTMLLRHPNHAAPVVPRGIPIITGGPLTLLDAPPLNLPIPMALVGCYIVIDLAYMQSP